MQARVGDKLHVHSNKVGEHDKIAVILDVRGERGAPPYFVRFEDGRESLIYPGSDCIVEPASARS